LSRAGAERSTLTAFGWDLIDGLEAKAIIVSEKTLSIPRYATTFTGEVLERLLSRPPDKSLLRVRMVRGIWTRGPAQLVDTAGNSHPVVILGAAIVDGRPPEKIDAGSDFIMIEGVAASDIKPEQLLIQRANAG